MKARRQIPGYTYGMRDVTRSPVSAEEFERLKRTVLFSEEDEKYLRLTGEVIMDQLEELLDAWFGSVPDLRAVLRRSRQWVLDTCNTPYDEVWLNYAPGSVCDITGCLRYPISPCVI